MGLYLVHLNVALTNNQAASGEAGGRREKEQPAFQHTANVARASRDPCRLLASLTKAATKHAGSFVGKGHRSVEAREIQWFG